MKSFFKNIDLGCFLARSFWGVFLVTLGVSLFLKGANALRWLGGTLNCSHSTGTCFTFGLCIALLLMMGGILFILGLWFRWVSAFFALILLSILIKTVSSWKDVLSINTAFLFISLGILISLVFIGPGRWSIDRE